MKIGKAKQLSSRKFKRLTGVTRQSFELMVGLIKANDQKKKKPGRRPKLIIEDQVLMVLQFWWEYRTYYHIGLDWGLINPLRYLQQTLRATQSCNRI